jgi:sugar lactone lactonase YvrE
MIKRLFIFLGFLVLALLLASCSTAVAPTSTASSKTPPATLGNASISSITLAAKSDGATFHTPLDSTPDVEATTIYFTATGSHGPGIFRVPAGGGAVTEVFSGAPFVAPRALAFSPDGTRLVIADTAADRTGELFTLAINGEPPYQSRVAWEAPQKTSTCISKMGNSWFTLQARTLKVGSLRY